jgi:hypothetical protein
VSAAPSLKIPEDWCGYHLSSFALDGRYVVMVIDLVITSAPKPPGSRQLISPPAVLEMAPAKVLQGSVRLHGWFGTCGKAAAPSIESDLFNPSIPRVRRKTAALTPLSRADPLSRTA